MSKVRWVPAGDPIQYLELQLPPPFKAFFTTRNLREPGDVPEVGRISWLDQVHGREVLRVHAPLDGLAKADGQLTGWTGFFLGVQVADCFPVYLADPEVPCIGLVHAGWRSSAARIVEMAVGRMVHDLGARPRRLIAAFGPGICFEHYEVGPEFRETFGEFVCERDGKLLLDLETFNRSFLLDLGVKDKNIIPSPFCTFEREDLFFSYRRDGEILGEMWALLGMDRLPRANRE